MTCYWSVRDKQAICLQWWLLFANDVLWICSKITPICACKNVAMYFLYTCTSIKGRRAVTFLNEDYCRSNCPFKADGTSSVTIRKIWVFLFVSFGFVTPSFYGLGSNKPILFVFVPSILFSVGMCSHVRPIFPLLSKIVDLVHCYIQCCIDVESLSFLVSNKSTSRHRKGTPFAFSDVF